MAIINKSTKNKCRKGCGEKGILLHCWWECKLVQPLWKTAWQYLRKLNIELPYDPAIPLLCIYPDKTFIEKNTCTCMFIAALFTIAKTCKQTVHRQTNGLRCGIYIQWNTVYTHWILLSHKKKKNNSIFSNTDGTRGSKNKWSKSERDRYHMISLIESNMLHKWTFPQKRNKPMDLQNILMVAKGKGRE